MLDGRQYGNDDIVDSITGVALPLAYNAISASADHNCGILGDDAVVHVLG